MEQNKEDDIEVKIEQIEKLVKEFKEKFEEGTKNIEKFITINEIEGMWSNLRKDTDNIYCDMVCDLMSTVDERELICKKKWSITKKELS